MLSNVPSFKVPDELTIEGFLGVKPVEAEPGDGYWCYEVNDKLGIKLRISFDIFEGSFQTTLSVQDQEISTVSQEGAVELAVVKGTILQCEFEYENARSEVQIQLQPQISVNWSTLVVA